MKRWAAVLAILLSNQTGVLPQTARPAAAQLVGMWRLVDIKQRMAAEGAMPVGNTPDEFAAYMRTEAQKWLKVVKQSGAKAD